MNAKIDIELSPRLLKKIQRLVNEGGFKNVSDFFETAGHYYLERHTDELWAEYVDHEIKAGLYEEY